MLLGVGLGPYRQTPLLQGFVSLVALLTWRDLLFCAKDLFFAAIGRRSPRRAAPRPRRAARARPPPPAGAVSALIYTAPVRHGRSLRARRASLCFSLIAAEVQRDEHPQMLAALNSIVVEFLFLPRSPALLNILLECSGSPSGTI
jgi:hypothetical protein